MKHIPTNHPVPPGFPVWRKFQHSKDKPVQWKDAPLIAGLNRQDQNLEHHQRCGVVDIVLHEIAFSDVTFAIPIQDIL